VLGVQVVDLSRPPISWVTADPAPATCPVDLPIVPDYIDEEVLRAVRETMREMLIFENKVGAAAVLAPASEMLASLSARAQLGAVAPNLVIELAQTVGELAEIAGWFGFDAAQHDAARSMNMESRHWLSLAGDIQTDWLTVQNMAMHSCLLGRPGEALFLSRSVLARSDLTPRIRALFLIREARAMAQQGDWSATRVLASAQQLWAEGTTAGDPAWCWWVDERELRWHEAMVLRDLAQLPRAVEHLELALDAVGPSEHRKRFSHRVYLLRAQVEARAWDEVEKTVSGLTREIPECQSTRTLLLLADTVDLAPVEALAPVAEELKSIGAA
jgi:hypothetical protein